MPLLALSSRGHTHQSENAWSGAVCTAAGGTQRKDIPLPQVPINECLKNIDELPELWDVFIGKMSFVGPRPDVPGYADQLTGTDRDVLQLRPGITGPASLKYRNEEELLANISERLKQEEVLCINGIEIRSVQEYNDRIIYPDKVRLNYYYFHHYSFIQDIRMIIATIFGKQIEYAGEKI